MTADEARAVVGGGLLDDMLRLLRLGEWRIDILYEQVPRDSAFTAGDAGDRNLGLCCAEPRYRWAQIWIDPREHDSPADVRRTLRHELLHVVLAEYEIARKTALQGLSGVAEAMLEEVWGHATELTVGHLERILDGG